MADTTFLRAVDAHAVGHFSDALKLLRANPAREGSETYFLQQALLVELLELTGDYDAAERIGDALMGISSLPPILKARVLLHLSRINWYRDKVEESWQQAMHACQAVAEVDDIAQFCRCQLRLLTLEMNRAPLDTLRPRLIDLRKNVYRTADPHLIVQMRLRTCEIEAKQGNTASALRHIGIARKLLKDYPNLQLEAQCAIDASAIAYHSGDFLEAIREAKAALHCSATSGYSYGKVAAVGNLGLVHVSLGNVDEAVRYHRQYVGLVNGLPGLERHARDLYAQALMLLGHTEQSGEVLADDLPLFEQITDRSWELIGSGLTQVRLFRHHERWEEAAQLAENLIRNADASNYRWYAVVARSTAIEPLTHVDRLADAVSRAIEAEALAYEAPLDACAAVMLAKSFAFVAAGCVRIGARFAESGMATARVISDLPKQIEARNVLMAVVTGHSLNTPLQPGEAQSRPLLTRRYDTATSLPTDGTSIPPLLSVSSVFDCGSNAQLLADEAFTLLYQSGCASALALVVREPFKPPHIISYAGWGYREVRGIAAKPNTRNVIHCGSYQNRDYELIIEPKHDIESRCVAVAIEKLIRAALTLERLRREEKSRASIWPLDDSTLDMEGVFVAAAMTEILTTAKRIAPTTLPVLLTGETGTGKEVLARAIHRSSPRTARPFVPFNCAAVPRDMVESQLFGYRRGAFTGAHEAFSGIIRGATGGTLFLDEIGDLSLEVQPKLLRFLETGEIHPLGDAQPIQADVRVIAATNAHLDKMVAEGRFREDLFYRLNVIRFRLPALRERREEIPPLVHHFVRRFTDEFRKGRIRLTEETMEYLLLYRWPGNVRQLENELRRMIALAENDQVLTPAHLSPEIRESRRTVPATDHAPAAHEMVVRMDQPLAAAVESLERHMVQRAIDLANGHVTEAAKMLGVSRKGLFLMRKRWGIGEKGSSIQSGS